MRQVRTAAVNSKGGTTKTTSVTNFCAAGAEFGLNILAVDFDAQAGLTELSGFLEPDFNIADYGSHRLVMEEDIMPGDLVLKTDYGYDLIPASMNELTEAESFLDSIVWRDVEMAERLKILGRISKKFNSDPRMKEYDLIICDTKGSAGQLVRSILNMTGDYFICNPPSQACINQIKNVLNVAEGINTTLAKYPGFNPIELRGHFFTRVIPTRKAYKKHKATALELMGDKHLQDSYIGVIEADLDQAEELTAPYVCVFPEDACANQYRSLFTKLFPELF